MRFDVVIVSDFRFPGGTSSCVAHEVRALHCAGYTVALVQMRAPVLKAERLINPQIQACLDRGEGVLVDAAGDALEARLAVLHNPYVFTEPLAPPQRISAGQKVLVVHQPVLDSAGVPYYDPRRIQDVCEELVGKGVVWAPISAVIRRNMEAARLSFPILDEDWTI